MLPTKYTVIFTDIPIFKPIIPHVSGIYNSSLKFYTDNTNVTLLANMLFKFVYTVFGSPIILSKLDLLLRLENFFKLDVKMDNIYYYTVAQHMIMNIFPRFKGISTDILELLTENLVDYSGYYGKEISPLNVIEAIVFKNTALGI